MKKHFLSRYALHECTFNFFCVCYSTKRNRTIKTTRENTAMISFYALLTVYLFTITAWMNFLIRGRGRIYFFINLLFFFVPSPSIICLTTRCFILTSILYNEQHFLFSINYKIHICAYIHLCTHSLFTCDYLFNSLSIYTLTAVGAQ